MVIYTFICCSVHGGAAHVLKHGCGDFGKEVTGPLPLGFYEADTASSVKMHNFDGKTFQRNVTNTVQGTSNTQIYQLFILPQSL